MKTLRLNIDIRRFVIAIVMLIATDAFAHGNRAFVNGHWFDGTKFVPKTMYSVDNVLRSTYEGEAKTIDLAGRYVVPPFADAHNHVFADWADVDDQLRRYLGAGIFYVKNPNNLAKPTAARRARLNRPETVDVLYSNGGLTATGGHPTQIYANVAKQIPGWTAADMADQAYFLVDSPADVDRKWPLIREGKPDFIKVYLENTGTPRDRGLDPAVLRAVVARAHADKLTVSAHVTSTADVHVALEASVDEITHLPLAPIDPADAALAAKRGVTFVTTTLSHRPAEGVADLAALHRANLALLKKAGVKVILGVDNGDRNVIHEAENVRKLGVYSDLELLQMLTEATPQAIFPARKIGRLEDGAEASLLALDGNPLEDFGALRRIALRVKQGHVLEIAPEKPSIAEALMPVVMERGVEAAITEYRRLERDEPAKWDFREPRLNQLGYALLNHGKNAEAIAVFKLNTEKYPKSSNVWDSLAEAYMKAGQRELAIANYRKSLELNPNNKNAAEMLKKLTE